MDYIEFYKKLINLTEEEKKLKIENILNNENKINKDDLRFLYFITLQEFNKIKNDRNIIDDIKTIFNCNEYEIGIDIKDFYNKKVKYFYSKENYLNTREFDIKPDVSNLEVIIGGLNIDHTRPLTFDNLKLITGNLSINKLSNFDGLKKLEVVNGSIECEDLLYDDNFLNLKLVLGICDFKSLKKVDKLKSCNILNEIILNNKTKNKELIDSNKLILKPKKEINYMKKHISYFTD